MPRPMKLYHAQIRRAEIESSGCDGCAMPSEPLRTGMPLGFLSRKKPNWVARLQLKKASQAAMTSMIAPTASFATVPQMRPVNAPRPTATRAS